MKIAAGCTFYNTSDILPLAIENLMSLGVKDFYLIDHFSNDKTSDLILEKFSSKVNFRIVRKTSKPFLQGRMITILSILAKEDNFDFFIPFDSDEFLDTKDSSANLKNELEIEFDKNQLAILVDEIDYIQSSDVRFFHEDTIRNIKYSAKVKLQNADSYKEKILSGGSALARKKSSKVILNLNSPLFNQDIIMAEGAHTVNNYLASDLKHSRNLVIRHLPFRSLESVYFKKIDGLRRDEAGFAKDVGFQSRQLIDMEDDVILKYWLSNSWTKTFDHVDLAVHSPLVDVSADNKFLQVYARILNFRSQFGDKLSSSKGESEFVKWPNLDFVEKAFSIALDYSAGFPKWTNIEVENVHLKNLAINLQAELDGVREDYELLADKYNNILRSRGWKILNILRKVLRRQ